MKKQNVILRFSCCFIFFQHWFTELPPVLTFELSRFEFNQALGRPEKIHNKLEFPQVLYLDRYGLIYNTTFKDKQVNNYLTYRRILL